MPLKLNGSVATFNFGFYIAMKLWKIKKPYLFDFNVLKKMPFYF